MKKGIEVPMRRIRFLLYTLILVIVSQPVAIACSLEETDFNVYFERAEHVFVGRLATGQDRVVTVETVLKGTPFTEASIKIPEFPTSCDLVLDANERYLFMQNGEPPFELNIGSGTVGLSYLPKDWDEELARRSK